MSSIFIDKFSFLILQNLALRNILRHAFRRGMFVLNCFEKHIIEKNFIPKWPPIFIIGLPRSGSTLLYQILTYGLSLSYFCNLVEKFYLCPGVISLILTKLTKISPPYNFLSYYGDTSGWNAPSQGRMIWNRLLKFNGEYHNTKEISKNQLKEIRSTIGIVERTFNMPFINKYQLFCSYIFQLAQAFPNAIFIKIRRNPLQIAQSILFARRELFGDSAAWFSVKPREYKEIENIDPIRQVCEQVYYLEKNIMDDLESMRHKSIFEVSYKEFCANPRKIISEFADFYYIHTGIKLLERGKLPLKFDIRRNLKVSKEEYHALHWHIKRLFSDYFQMGRI